MLIAITTILAARSVLIFSALLLVILAASLSIVTNGQVHLALSKGNWESDEEIMVRVNSTLINNDVIGTLTTNPDHKLGKMFDLINKEGKGVVVFINQEFQAFDLIKRLKDLKKVKENDLNPVIKMDNKDIGIGAQILHDLKERNVIIGVNKT